MSKPTDLWNAVSKLELAISKKILPHLTEEETQLVNNTWLVLWGTIKRDRYHTYIAANISNKYYH